MPSQVSSHHHAPPQAGQGEGQKPNQQQPHHPVSRQSPKREVQAGRTVAAKHTRVETSPKREEGGQKREEERERKERRRARGRTLQVAERGRGPRLRAPSGRRLVREVEDPWQGGASMTVRTNS